MANGFGCDRRLPDLEGEYLARRRLSGSCDYGGVCADLASILGVTKRGDRGIQRSAPEIGAVSSYQPAQGVNADDGIWAGLGVDIVHVWHSNVAMAGDALDSLDRRADGVAVCATLGMDRINDAFGVESFAGGWGDRHRKPSSICEACTTVGCGDCTFVVDWTQVRELWCGMADWFAVCSAVGLQQLAVAMAGVSGLLPLAKTTRRNTLDMISTMLKGII